MELLSKNILHGVLALHHPSDDARLCADKRTRKGVEVWRLLFPCFSDNYSVLVFDIQEAYHWN